MRSKRFAILGFFGIFFFYFFFKFIDLALFAVTPSSTEAMTQTVTVERMLRPKNLTERLEANGIVTHSSKMLKLGIYLSKWKNLKAGEYRLSGAMTPLEIFQVLNSGVSVSLSVTFPEGNNMYQIADALEKRGLVSKNEFLRLCKNKNFMRSLGFASPLPPSLEGYLFPETYFFNRSMTVEQMLGMMTNRFKKAWTESREKRARQLGMNRHQVITLASIIEKETGAPGERRTISSVFHNRIQKKMRLESDPTTIYGIWEKFNGNLRRHHLKEKNAYNTYAKRGLPIGPIANPGEKAIDAALMPESTHYLFFVSKNDGTHVFSKDFKSHQRAVNAFQKNRKARQGKSWRDLSKKNKNTK